MEEHPSVQPRKKIRQYLIAGGWRRTGYTTDSGDGAYQEFWTRRVESGPNEKMTLAWGPRELIDQFNMHIQQEV